MKPLFVTRARHEALQAEADRQRARAEKAEQTAAAEVEARQSIARQHAELDAERVAQLEARVEELTALGVRANAALDDMADKVKAAEERARIAARPTVVEERTVDGAPLVRREPSSTRLKRAEARCAALAEQLGLLQDSHIADTRELHDLRQGQQGVKL